MPNDRAADVQTDELTVMAKDATKAEAAAPPPPASAPPANGQDDSGNLQTAQSLGAVQYGSLIADDRTFAGEAPNQVDAPPQVASDFVGLPGSTAPESVAAESGANAQIAQAGQGAALDQAAGSPAAPGQQAQLRAAGSDPAAVDVPNGQSAQTGASAGADAPVVVTGQAIDPAPSAAEGAAAGGASAAGTAESSTTPTESVAGSIASPLSANAFGAPGASAPPSSPPIAAAPPAAPPVDTAMSELRGQLLDRLRDLDVAIETPAAPVAPPEAVESSASAPTLGVSIAAGAEDTAIALDVRAALTDLDGSETLSVTISGVPTGGALSAGTNNGDGSWTLTSEQLPGLTLTPPADFAGALTLNVAATATETLGGATQTTMAALTVDVAGAADTPTLSASNVSGTEDTAIALNIASALSDSSETLGVTIAGVPDGATLSAGTDLGGGAWLVTPGDLAGLTLTPPANYAGTINLSVTATSTDGATTASTTTNFAVAVAGAA
ncbi:MAG: hypothetical protein ING19_06900, partial [Azospirillum sp.]|nr:hypothetical protein [Azospirillum sp.]